MPIPSKHRGSIGGTGAKGYTAATVSNESKHREKAPINNRSGFNHFTKDGPGFPPILPITNDKPNKQSRKPVPSKDQGNKRRVIGNSRAKQGFLFDTISCSAKFRSKVPIPTRSRFNHFTKDGPGFPSIPPFSSKHHAVNTATGAKGYMAETGSNDSKHREKAAVTAHLGFNHFTKDGPGIPTIPSALPGRPNKFEHIKPRYNSDTSANISKKKGMPPIKSVDAPQQNLIVPIGVRSTFVIEPDVDTAQLFDFVIGDKHSYDAKYQCTKEIFGEGEFGIVKKGLQISDHQPVAIKTLKMNQDQVVRWGQLKNGQFCPLEICILYQLKGCSGVNQLLDAYNVDGTYILVLEMVNNCITLENFMIRNEALHECNIAQPFFRRLVTAVHQCQLMGVYHRDLKEANILIIETTGTPYLIDFGCGALTTDSPYYDVAGSEGYLPPELISADVSCYEGEPAAVYTLGVILKDMVLGIFPDVEYDPEEISDYVTWQCLDLIDAMVKECPNDRPTLEEILQHPWLNE